MSVQTVTSVIPARDGPAEVYHDSGQCDNPGWYVRYGPPRKPRPYQCLDADTAEEADAAARVFLAGVGEGRADGRWVTGDVAAYLGVAPSTVRAYVTRGQMPAPDGRLGRTPWWWPHTIKAWRTGHHGT